MQFENNISNKHYRKRENSEDHIKLFTPNRIYSSTFLLNHLLLAEDFFVVIIIDVLQLPIDASIQSSSFLF